MYGEKVGILPVQGGDDRYSLEKMNLDRVDNGGVGDTYDPFFKGNVNVAVI